MSERFVPYDRSQVWTRQDEYFATRGVSAWMKGDIPFLSTSNHAVARQHAALLVAVARGVPEDEPVHVLEVGGGLGTFATNLHHALDDDLGDEGRRLAKRLRYVFSDSAAGTLRDASRGPELAPLVARGRVTPLLYDVRRPAALHGLDGAPVSPPRFAAVLANYVCCVVPAKIVQKSAGGYRQLCVSGFGEEQEMLFLPADLEAIFPDARERRMFESLVADLPEATVTFPHAFLEFLAGVGEVLRPDGVVVVTDYGTVARDALRGLHDIPPTMYGGSINHDVSFAAFDAYAEVSGANVIRTSDPLATIHTALVARAPIAAALAQAFHDHFVAAHAGQDLLDRTAAARHFLGIGEWARAVRFFTRALELDPRNAEFCLRIGQAHLAAGRYELALAVLRRGAELDLWRRYDFTFELARAYSHLRQYPDAIRHYEASILRDPHPTSLTNLATIHEELGDLKSAYRCYRRALEIQPDWEDAFLRLERMKAAWWEEIAVSLLED